MKITIRPPLKIDVNGKHCVHDCVFFSDWVCQLWNCTIKKDSNKYLRCQDCLDAEQETHERTTKSP